VGLAALIMLAFSMVFAADGKHQELCSLEEVNGLLILQGFWHCKNHQLTDRNLAVPPWEGRATSANQVSSADVFKNNTASASLWVSFLEVS